MSSDWLSRFVELALPEDESGVVFTCDVRLFEEDDRGHCAVAAAAAECEGDDVLLGEDGIEAAKEG